MVKSLRGSYTVEAVFVMSITLAVIMVVFYSAFIVHDEIIMASCVTRDLSENASINQKEVQKKMLFCQINKVEKKSNKLLKQVAANIYYQVPVPNYLANIFFTSQEKELIRTYEIYKASELMWDYTEIKEGLKWK